MSELSVQPAFAVVGHPNKGKSSIVATLAQDETVGIGLDPGTTTVSRRYPVRLGEEVLYTLIDTPGFQRARAALGWMKQHESTADQHPAVVADFLASHHGGERFRDECELLRPITEGAGILYVVDGTVPYGQEYEPEMEILRWTGRPSMALINPIGDASHIDEWRRALDQFFRIVRVFDAHTADFTKRLELLRAFGQLHEGWREPLDRAVDRLTSDRAERLERAARAIAEGISQAMSLEVAKKLGKNEDPKPQREPLLETYRGKLRQIEKRSRDTVEQIYHFNRLHRREAEVELLEDDLFSERAWLLFGLKRRDLVLAGMASGGAAGAWIDLTTGGASFLLGSAIGATIGGAVGWLSASKLSDLRVIDKPLGGRELRCGPAINPNLGFVLLGRARYHHAALMGRTHAQRGELAMDGSQQRPMPDLSDAQKKQISKLLKRLSKPHGDDAAFATDELADAVHEILLDDAAPAAA